MTTYRKYLKTSILAALFTIFSFSGNNASAQRIPDELNFKLDWQLNAPIGSDFVNGMTGWGMSFETAYEVYGPWSLGAFASFHTNHGYDERRTIQLSPTQTLNTDQQHSSFQVPFGALVSYTLFDNGFGFHVAAYYNYSTNNNDLLDYNENGMSNLGLRLGVCF